MKNLKKLWTGLLAVTVILITALTTPAFAISLDEAKAQGLVGEKPDGYLGVVNAGSAEVQALVSQINAQRRAKYAEIAAKNNTSIQSVEALAAKKAITITPSGQYVQLSDGTWKRK